MGCYLYDGHDKVTSATGPLLVMTPPRELLVLIDRVDPTDAVLTSGSLLDVRPSDLVVWCPAYSGSALEYPELTSSDDRMWLKQLINFQ